MGFILDDKLKFNCHINYIVGKISRSAGILYKIRNSLPLYARLNFYYSFIYPYLSYNIIIWGATNPSHLHPLIVQHKRIIRILTDSNFMEHTSPLFHRLKLLKLMDIYKFQLLLHTRKALLNGQFQCLHNIQTRNRNFAVASFQRLSRTQQSVSYMGPSLWNNLPDNLRQENTLNSFKRKLKIHFLEQYI